MSEDIKEQLLRHPSPDLEAGHTDHQAAWPGADADGPRCR